MRHSPSRTEETRGGEVPRTGAPHGVLGKGTLAPDRHRHAHEGPEARPAPHTRRPPGPKEDSGKRKTSGMKRMLFYAIRSDRASSFSNPSRFRRPGQSP